MHQKGWIDSKLKKHVLPTNTRSGRVKGNPKMHKKNIPLCTIISRIDHPTERLAEVAEKELNEWVSGLPTYGIQHSSFKG